MLSPHPFRLLLDTQGGDGGGEDPNSADEGKGDEGKGGAAPPAAPAPKAGARGPDLAKQAENLTAKHGDPNVALMVLLGENYKLRDGLREATKAVPPEGARVLYGDDAKLWDSYRELGDPPAIRKAVRERDEFSGKVQKFERESELRAVADKARIDGAPVKYAVLKTLAADLVFGEDTAKDKAGKEYSFVTVAAPDGAEPVPFEQYAAAHWADFLPALRADGAGAPRAPGTPSRDRPSGAGAAPGAAPGAALGLPQPPERREPDLRQQLRQMGAGVL
jgi:hypothetical protein